MSKNCTSIPITFTYYCYYWSYWDHRCVQMTLKYHWVFLLSKHSQVNWLNSGSLSLTESFIFFIFLQLKKSPHCHANTAAKPNTFTLSFTIIQAWSKSRSTFKESIHEKVWRNCFTFSGNPATNVQAKLVR